MAASWQMGLKSPTANGFTDMYGYNSVMALQSTSIIIIFPSVNTFWQKREKSKPTSFGKLISFYPQLLIIH